MAADTKKGPIAECDRCGHPIFPKDGMCQGCGKDTQIQ